MIQRLPGCSHDCQRCPNGTGAEITSGSLTRCGVEELAHVAVTALIPSRGPSARRRHFTLVRSGTAVAPRARLLPAEISLLGRYQAANFPGISKTPPAGVVKWREREASTLSDRSSTYARRDGPGPSRRGERRHHGPDAYGRDAYGRQDCFAAPLGHTASARVYGRHLIRLTTDK
jgi:hypothetical protein